MQKTLQKPGKLSCDCVSFLSVIPLISNYAPNEFACFLANTGLDQMFVLSDAYKVGASEKNAS